MDAASSTPEFIPRYPLQAPTLNRSRLGMQGKNPAKYVIAVQDPKTISVLEKYFYLA